MSERDPSDWRRAEHSSEREDSIAGKLASRIDALPPAPGDAVDWAAAAAGYEREADALGGGPAAAQLLYEVGRILEERLGDSRSALQAHRRAFAIDPAFVPNLRACRRIAMDRGEDAIAAEVLEAEAACAESAEARSELLLLRGRLLAAMGREGESTEVLSQAAALAPSAFAASEETARAAAARGDRETLADAYVRCAHAVAAPRLSAHYLAAAAAVFEEALGRADRAAELSLEAFALAPDDPLIRAVARRHAERLGDTARLSAILRAEAEGSPGRAEPWIALAELEERLGHPEAALDALERGREAAPGEPLVLSGLVRMRERQAAWSEVSETLEALSAAHLSRSDPGHLQEAILTKLRRAELEEVRLGRQAVALECCRAVLDLDPGNRTALAALGRLSAAAGDWDGLLAAFEAEAAAAGDPRERARRTFKAAEVLEERLGRVPAAIARYREALALDVDFVPARAALERLYQSEGHWEELCALLETDLGEEPLAPADRVAQLFRIAQLRAERLADLAGAAASYRNILELDPGNRLALSALDSALVRVGETEELVEVLAREAELAGDPRRMVIFQQRRAELLETRLDDPERARTAWEQLLATAPTHLAALRALGRLHARAARWGELAAMCRAQAHAAVDKSTSADLLFRAGELLERSAEGNEAAIAAYREALSAAPTHLPALRSLARIYRARGDDAHLLEVLQLQGGAHVAPPERAASLCEAAHIAEALGEPERSIDLYEEALRIAPGFTSAVRALDRLYAETGREDALAALRRSAPVSSAGDRAERLLALARFEAERSGDHAAALEALGVLLRVAPDHPSALLLELRLATGPERRARARAALASVATDPGTQAALLAAAAVELRPASARREGLARAAALAPESAALGPEEERRLRLAGDFPALARLLETRCEESRDPAAHASWSVRAGEAWDRAGEPDRAVAAFQRALEDAPASVPALRGTRALLARRGDWAGVRATLETEAASLRDGPGAAAAWLEAAAVAERLQDLEGAREACRRALSADPSHDRARRFLAHLEAAGGG